MFYLAKGDGKLRDVPTFPMVKEARPRQGFFEREQYEKLFAELPDYLQLPFSIGYFSGMREGEILGLEWSQVDFLHGVIGCVRAKPRTTKREKCPSCHNSAPYSWRSTQCANLVVTTSVSSSTRGARRPTSGIQEGVVFCLYPCGTRTDGAGEGLGEWRAVV
jgi:hypothetical protein